VVSREAGLDERERAVAAREAQQLHVSEVTRSWRVDRNEERVLHRCASLPEEGSRRMSIQQDDSPAAPRGSEPSGTPFTIFNDVITRKDDDNDSKVTALDGVARARELLCRPRVESVEGVARGSTFYKKFLSKKQKGGFGEENVYQSAPDNDNSTPTKRRREDQGTTRCGVPSVQVDLQAMLGTGAGRGKYDSI
jgi:hypothetical protein